MGCRKKKPPVQSLAHRRTRVDRARPENAVIYSTYARSLRWTDARRAVLARVLSYTTRGVIYRRARDPGVYRPAIATIRAPQRHMIAIHVRAQACVPPAFDACAPEPRASEISGLYTRTRTSRPLRTVNKQNPHGRNRLTATRSRRTCFIGFEFLRLPIVSAAVGLENARETRSFLPRVEIARCRRASRRGLSGLYVATTWKSHDDKPKRLERRLIILDSYQLDTGRTTGCSPFRHR